ncbi:MAG: hypothetical protein NC132_02580 [Corallococcus sp.]|nr:hypothetical protein [Corallococcus sp.]MCM1358994.1 hypothetical protein [Corallococcus sp.]MCM1394983.1 hypothetical protein [Corallococcus sp.]
MKKILVIALAVLMLVGAVSVLAACSGGETYTGYCYYPSPYGNGGYGCVVDVTVKGDTIVAVKLYTDEEAAAWAKNNEIMYNDAKVEWAEGTHRTSPQWMGEKEFAAFKAAYPEEAKQLEDTYQAPHGGDIGFTMTEAGYEAWFEEIFVGKTVAEVNRYAAFASSNGQAVADDGLKMTGATQSSARVIVAVKDALSKIEAK